MEAVQAQDNVQAVPDMSAEQAADLAALRQTVAAEAPPGQMSDTAAAVPMRPELAMELAALIGMAAGALSPAFPSLKEIYTEPTTQAAAAAIAAVCHKHGWLQGGIGGKWGEEIAAAAILLPLAWATYNGVQGDIEKRRKASPKAKAEAIAQEPGQSTVTFGAPVEAQPEPAVA